MHKLKSAPDGIFRRSVSARKRAQTGIDDIIKFQYKYPHATNPRIKIYIFFKKKYAPILQFGGN